MPFRQRLGSGCQMGGRSQFTSPSHHRKIKKKKKAAEERHGPQQQAYTLKKGQRAWQHSYKGSRTREGLLQTQAEELKCRNEVDKVTRCDLADGLGELKKLSDETEVILEHNKAPRGSSNRSHSCEGLAVDPKQ